MLTMPQLTMHLFHQRVLQRQLKNVTDVPANHTAILTAWAKNLAAGNYDRETQSDAEFIQRILIDVLGYVGSSAGTAWTLAKNQPVGTGNVDVALGRFTADEDPEIYAPFELKGAKTRDLDAVMPGRNKSPVQQAWEYAMDAKGAKWVLVSNLREIRLYAIGYGRKDYESFDLANMATPENYRRFTLLLSADSLLSGRTLQLLKDSGVVEREITQQLYAEYKATRAHLFAELRSASGTMSAAKAIQFAQTILDRVLFVAFAEDKGLLKKGTLKEVHDASNHYNPQPIWESFKGLFNAIDKGNARLAIPGYNGGLFATNSEIDALRISDETCKLFANLGSYDYDSDVSVNILGHIFEQSISDIEELKNELNPRALDLHAVGAKRHTDGIFYTPAFITRYIVEHTVGRWLGERKAELGFDSIEPLTEEDYASIRVVGRGKKKGAVTFNANVRKHIWLWEAYRTRFSSIRVLDPACGSGAFLNEVFDFLHREGQSINRTLDALHGGQANLFRWDTHILANNIFGVDINRESVEITKLSLWLKTANRNERLTYLDDNIKVGNSLIVSVAVAGDSAFDWSIEFPGVVQSGGFDIVIGNPPYVDSEMMARAWPVERDYISRTFNQTRGNWDLYIAFFELGCNLLADGGYLSFISPDKWLSKDFGIELRRRVAPGIVSFLPLGRDVFESSLVDSIITTIGSRPTDSFQVLSKGDGEVVVSATIDKSELDQDDRFDQVLSPSYVFLRKMERAGQRRLRDFALAENACATSDTYKLGNILRDARSSHGYDAAQHYKIANTGTLDRYAFRWGIRPMRYLKHDYAFPIVSRNEFSTALGATYKRRAASPKIIIKGLTLLDAALDLDGSFVPGKSTLVICSTDVDMLKFLGGILNSRLISFYVTQKFASASYNGGVNFTPDMLNGLPIPDGIDREGIVRNVGKILSAQAVIVAETSALFATIRASCGVAKLRAQLERWFDLSTMSFTDELSHQGLDLSVRRKAEWADVFDRGRAQVADSLVNLRAADSAIDDLVFDAYRLDARERAQFNVGVRHRVIASGMPTC